MLELNDYITTLNLISQTSEEDQANVTRFVSTLPKGFRTELSKAVEAINSNTHDIQLSGKGNTTFSYNDSEATYFLRSNCQDKSIQITVNDDYANGLSASLILKPWDKESKDVQTNIATLSLYNFVEGEIEQNEYSITAMSPSIAIIRRNTKVTQNKTTINQPTESGYGYIDKNSSIFEIPSISDNYTPINEINFELI